MFRSRSQIKDTSKKIAPKQLKTHIKLTSFVFWPFVSFISTYSYIYKVSPYIEAKREKKE